MNDVLFIRGLLMPKPMAPPADVSECDAVILNIIAVPFFIKDQSSIAGQVRSTKISDVYFN